MMGKLTKILMHAVKFPALPHFIILDEMNLSHIEKYFAPFLSAMETPELPVRIHDGDRPIDGIPPLLEHWPRNLFIGCTINMDETTHPISDKVLDRAFTIELWDADLPKFFAGKPSTPDLVKNVLIKLYDILRSTQSHFGYRTANEICLFVTSGCKLEGENESLQIELLDQAIYSKVLPKIRGQRSDALVSTLNEARNLCESHDLKRSKRKLDRLIEQLSTLGITRFWT